MGDLGLRVIRTIVVVCIALFGALIPAAAEDYHDGQTSSLQEIRGKLLGRWRGAYVCGQGQTAVDVVLTDMSQSGEITGTFNFGNLPGRHNAKSGSFHMRGYYSVASETLRMQPAGWISRPSGYAAAGFSASPDLHWRRLSGWMELAGCGAISLDRVGGAPSGAEPGYRDVDREKVDREKQDQLNQQLAEERRKADDLRRRLEIERRRQEEERKGMIQAGGGAAGVNPSPDTFPAPGSLRFARRIALVVGNGAYRNVPPLPNPVGDAQAMADSFRRLGFAEVTELHDVGYTEFSTALKDFGDRAAEADWAVIYYAGHGMEVGGQNYLVPVDARLQRATHVDDEAVPLDRVLAKAQSARKLRLVILDSCRNNPFASRIVQERGTTRAIGRGLGRIEPASGVLVGYAARDGNVAEDGASAHSPYTQALLDHLEEPRLEINMLFRRVRDSVFESTGGRQEPFIYGSLPGEEIYLK
jgi:hypothetical protein